ncbi:MAG TPA: hypothetical protein PK095_24675, partial [Myxococcota bacterium]|nr:hypothetical protein [Myxococcota bacterium]
MRSVKSMRSMRWMLNAVVVLGAALSGCKKSEPQPAPSAEAAPGDAAGANTQAKGEPRKVDLTDNAEVERVALESLKAYREKNLEKLAELGPPGARDKLIFLEPRNPNYATLLGDDTWRMKSLRAWAGDKLTKLSRGVDDVALGWYYEDETHQYAVEVRKNEGKWTFFDLVQKEKPGAKATAPAPAPTPDPAAAPAAPTPDPA